jgi:hypothetical protein
MPRLVGQDPDCLQELVLLIVKTKGPQSLLVFPCPVCPRGCMCHRQTQQGLLCGQPQALHTAAPDLLTLPTAACLILLNSPLIVLFNSVRGAMACPRERLPQEQAQN